MCTPQAPHRVSSMSSTSPTLSQASHSLQTPVLARRHIAASLTRSTDGDHESRCSKGGTVASLSAHLRQSETHGSLSFRADCPLCRAERLVGSFERGGLVSSRAPAALAAGVLAFSGGVPAPALASDGDSQPEGTAPVTQTDGADS